MTGAMRGVLGIGAALLLAAACESPCSKEEHVGGGHPGFEPGLVVHVASMRDGGDASAWSQLLGVDPAILSSADSDGSVHLVVGRGKDRVEAHAILTAGAEAKSELERTFELEPFLLEQVRIKPPQGRARCMLLREQMACALGDARLGRGTFAVQKLARHRADAGDTSDVLVAVSDERVLVDAVVPLLRDNLARVLTRAKAPPMVRGMVLEEYWALVVDALKEVRIEGEATGGRFHLIAELESRAEFSGMGTGAPVLSAAAGFVAASWRHEGDLPADVAPLAEYLAEGTASAIRMRDGAQVRLFSVRDVDGLQRALDVSKPDNGAVHAGLLTISDDPGAATAAAKLGLSSEDPEAWGAMMVDLAAFGGSGTMMVSLRRPREGRRATVEAELSRASLLSVARLLVLPP